MKDHAEAPDVEHLIWDGLVWSLARDAEGWRPYDGGGMHDPDSITGSHADHLHATVRAGSGVVMGVLLDEDLPKRLDHDLFPDFEGLEGIGDLREVIGALLTFVLIVAALMLIVCAIVWALRTASGHHAAATKARVGAWNAWNALGAAVLAGGGVAWLNCMIDLDDQF